MTICREWSLVKLTPEERRSKPLYCRSWNCQTCRPKRKSQLLALAASGEPDRFLTLTVNPNVGNSPEDRLKLLSHAWKVLVKRLRRLHGPRAIEYLAVVESTKRGEPHLHILLRSPYISQRLISDAMRELIDAPIVDIRKIRDARQVVSYVAKYVTKAPEQFGSAKRYWHSGRYELDKDDRKKEPWQPLFRWEICRQSEHDIVREWMQPGWKTTIDNDGRVRSVFVDSRYWQTAPPNPRALSRDGPL